MDHDYFGNGLNILGMLFTSLRSLPWTSTPFGIMDADCPRRKVSITVEGYSRLRCTLLETKLCAGNRAGFANKTQTLRSKSPCEQEVGTARRRGKGEEREEKLEGGGGGGLSGLALLRDLAPPRLALALQYRLAVFA